MGEIGFSLARELLKTSEASSRGKPRSSNDCVKEVLMTPLDIRDKQRRTLLHGFLAAAYLIYLPMLAGCRDKPLPRAEPNPNPGESPSPPYVPSSPSGLMTKAEVRYQDQPKGEQRCDQCVNFIPTSNSCQLVEGEISPQGWCSLWARKLT
jgi:hypothetical protein